MSTRGAFLGLALLGALAGCGDSSGPVAGELEIRLVSPNADDRAILFQVVGAQTGVTAAAGQRVFATSLPGDTTRIVVVAPAGGVLSGAVARLRVTDTRRAGSYAATLTQVAAADYTPRDTTGYRLSIVKP